MNNPRRPTTQGTESGVVCEAYINYPDDLLTCVSDNLQKLKLTGWGVRGCSAGRLVLRQDICTVKVNTCQFCQTHRIDRIELGFPRATAYMSCVHIRFVACSFLKRWKGRLLECYHFSPREASLTSDIISLSSPPPGIRCQILDDTIRHHQPFK